MVIWDSKDVKQNKKEKTMLVANKPSLYSVCAVMGLASELKESEIIVDEEFSGHRSLSLLEERGIKCVGLIHFDPVPNSFRVEKYIDRLTKSGNLNPEEKLFLVQPEEALILGLIKQKFFDLEVISPKSENPYYPFKYDWVTEEILSEYFPSLEKNKVKVTIDSNRVKVQGDTLYAYKVFREMSQIYGSSRSRFYYTGKENELTELIRYAASTEKEWSITTHCEVSSNGRKRNYSLGQLETNFFLGEIE